MTNYTNMNLVVENMENLKEALNNLNNISEEINSITQEFGHTNLKMHSYSYLLYLEIQKRNIEEQQTDDLFSNTMDSLYSRFEEWENEELEYVKREYIGNTSSFYYLTDSWGNNVDSYEFNEALKGKEVELCDYLGDLNSTLFEYLVNENITLEEFYRAEILEDFESDEADEIEDFLNEELEILENAYSDLEYLLEIVTEAKKAYDEIQSYKTEEFAQQLLEDDNEYLNELEEEAKQEA